MRLAPVLLAIASLQAQDVREIVRKSLERDMRNARALDDYTYEVKTIDRSYSGETVSKTTTSVVEVLQIDGSRYRRKIEKDGRALPPAEAKTEQEKLDQELARRRAESPAQRQKRIEAERKRTDDFRKMRQDIAAAFDFRLQGEETVGGARCWKVAAEPRKNASGLHSDLGKRILPKMRGTFWISQSSYEWLRVEAEAVDTIRFGWVLASLSKGSTFKMEQSQVSPGLWHPKHIEARLKARGLIVPFNTGTEVEFRNFRKFAAESRLLTGSTSEAPAKAPASPARLAQ